jgi:CRISPR-associated protein Csx16
MEKNNGVYELDYALSRLRDAVDYTEATKDPEGYSFIRRWINEVERSIKASPEDKRKPIIVSRHAGAIEWLRRRGIEGDVLSHVDYPQVVRGKLVVGNLPFHLAAEAEVVGVIEMPDLPAEARGRDLSADEMESYGARLAWYKVEKIVR